MIVTSSEGPLGDTLVTFPAIIELAKKHNGIYFEGSSGVYNLLPKEKYNIKPAFEIPTGNHEVIHLHIPTIRNKYGNHHMTVACMLEAGFPIPTELVLPIEVHYEEKPDVPYWDVVICGMNNGPHLTGERQWQTHKWQEVINGLTASGYSICALGSGENVRPFTGVEYFYDHSIEEVFSVIKKSKLTISIDTGISHIAHAVHANHILLHSHAAGAFWSGYPSNEHRIMIHGNLHNVSSEQVLELTKRFL